MLLFSVNGRKWEKRVTALVHHRLRCCKRDRAQRITDQDPGCDVCKEKMPGAALGKGAACVQLQPSICQKQVPKEKE